MTCTFPFLPIVILFFFLIFAANINTICIKNRKMPEHVSRRVNFSSNFEHVNHFILTPKTVFSIPG